MIRHGEAGENSDSNDITWNRVSSNKDCHGQRQGDRMIWVDFQAAANTLQQIDTDCVLPSKWCLQSTN